MNRRLHRLGMSQRYVHQCGVTLIELMISLTIGLFILAGLATIFSSTNISFKAQTGLVQLQNNQVQALTVLSNIIQSGGYYAAYPGNNTASALQAASSAIQPIAANTFFVPTSVGINSPTAIATTPTFSLNFATPSSSQMQAVFGGRLYSSTSGPDTIAVRAANAMDCTGVSHSSALTAVYSVFTVYNNNLICAIYDTNTSTWKNWQVLISGSTDVNGIQTGIAGMSILYEVDPSSSGLAMQYLTAASVTAASEWSSVIAVQITLNFFNPLYVSATATPGQPQYISVTRMIGLMSVV